MKLYQDKNWLIEQYQEKQLSLNEIAQIADCGLTTVFIWMDRYNISRRSLSETLKMRHDKNIQLYKDKNWLIEQYWGFDLSHKEMAKILNCDNSIISDWMKKYDIPLKEQKEFLIVCNKRDEQNRKKCPHCGQWKPENNFFKYKQAFDGFHDECKDCMNLYNGKWREKNLEHYKKWCKNYSKQYRQKHEEKIKKQKRQYWQEHKKELRKKKKEYYQKVKHTDVVKFARKRQREKRRNMKFIPLLTNPFPKEIKIDYHHINDFFVIPLPRVIHFNNMGKNHRDKCNLQIQNIYGLDINKILNL
jgi:predicted DNA-binding protein YlxM (UPF0122 family)